MLWWGGGGARVSAAKRVATPTAPLRAGPKTGSSSGGEAETHSVSPDIPSQGRARWVHLGRTSHCVH